eukprot:TRINITY_DN4189_c0_g1_i2.p1 TRINITY_DN4189_c0_g1~~TRINITY_DN4189_c0_g1_i2.p1  ORF type:complete len:297 (-),score=22.91 TRINITY_DN4189_c0_g1_i2:90-980(-)
MGSHHSHHVTGPSLELSRQECAAVPGSEFLEYEFESLSVIGKHSVKDTKREFLVFLPPSIKAAVKHRAAPRPPVVICLHGTDMSMWETHLRIQEDGSHALLELAEKEKFIAIFAQAKSFVNERLTGESTRQWGQHGKDADIIYLKELIKKATTDLNADPQRVYVVGFSLGGIFTAEVSVSLRDSVAAVCNWCGGIPTPRKWMDESLKTLTLGMRPDLCGPGRKMPVYLLTAEKDINRVEVDGAKSEYEKANWPIRYECQPGREHIVYADNMKPIWEFFSRYTLASVASAESGNGSD